MTECYDCYVPPPKDPKIKVGDKVEVIKPWSMDKDLGIKVGDIAKVTYVGDDHVRCNNPRWNLRSHEIGRAMGLDQVKLLRNPREELL